MGLPNILSNVRNVKDALMSLADGAVFITMMVFRPGNKGATVFSNGNDEIMMCNSDRC